MAARLTVILSYVYASINRAIDYQPVNWVLVYVIKPGKSKTTGENGSLL